MTCGDRCRRRMGFGYTFNGIRYDYESQLERCFKITYYIHTSPSYWDIYIGDDVCAYECSPGGWGTGTHAYGTPNEPLRSRIFTQCCECRVFNEDADIWISVST